MKTFDQLTDEQKTKAIEHAQRIINSSLGTGVLVLTPEECVLTNEELDKLTIEAAQNGTYDDNGNPYVEGMDVPYFFLGGCV